jgi:hypothetical protein
MKHIQSIVETYQQNVATHTFSNMYLSTNYSDINNKINSFLKENNINLNIIFIDKNIFYISNENNDLFYEIFIKKYQNNIDIDIIRNVVRHDDSIVSKKENSINISKNEIFNELQKYKIIDDEKLNKLINFIMTEIF